MDLCFVLFERIKGLDIKFRVDGQGLVEYGLIILLIAIVVIIILSAVGVRVENIYNQISASFPTS